MGLFSFIKNAGKKLGLGGDDTPPDAASVEKELASHDLGTNDVKIDVVDDKVVLKGVVKDQSTFEKAVVAVGNTLGIWSRRPSSRWPMAPLLRQRRRRRYSTP